MEVLGRLPTARQTRRRNIEENGSFQNSFFEYLFLRHCPCLRVTKAARAYIRVPIVNVMVTIYVIYFFKGLYTLSLAVSCNYQSRFLDVHCKQMVYFPGYTLPDILSFVEDFSEQYTLLL